jgi:hypothetical protein
MRKEDWDCVERDEAPAEQERDELPSVASMVPKEVLQARVEHLKRVRLCDEVKAAPDALAVIDRHWVRLRACACGQALHKDYERTRCFARVPDGDIPHAIVFGVFVFLTLCLYIGAN